MEISGTARPGCAGKPGTPVCHSWAVAETVLRPPAAGKSVENHGE